MILEQLHPTSGLDASNSQVAEASRRLTRLSLLPDQQLVSEQVTSLGVAHALERALDEV